MKDNLLIITRIKKTIIYLDKIVTNFPNKEKILRDNISNSLYKLLYLSYKANLTQNKYYKKELIIEIKLIDFYLNISVDKKYISYKKYISITNHLIELIKMIQGWINEKKN